MTNNAPTSLLCPECWTVFASDVHVCPCCCLKLDWLDRAGDFREALCAWAAAQLCELELRINSTGVTTTVTVPVGPSEPFSAGPLGDVRAEADSTGGLLTIHASSTSHSMPLPGECRIDGSLVSARVVARLRLADEALPIDAYYPDVISLTAGSRISLGSSCTENPFDVFLPMGPISLKHCLLIRQPPLTSHYWIVDASSSIGTFVNRKPILACRLNQGDLVQVGPYAFVFNALDGSLVPVKGLRGITLELQGVHVEGRLENLDLSIAAGQLVAVTGQSGSGKSTLIHAILESGDHGRVLANGHDVSVEQEWFRSVIGYVSQKEVIHGDLTAQEAVEYSGQLRGVTRMAAPLDRLLSQLELSRRVRSTRCHKLSGGESKRVRTAAELISEPQLLVLDEPASGLDRGREEGLLRLLRTLSFRGCTVIVVTHSLHHLETFDRVLVLRGGRRVFWGTPAELKQLIPSGNLEDLDLREVKSDASETVVRRRAKSSPLPPTEGRRRRQGFWRQTWTLLRRELSLLKNASLRRVAVPLAILPAFFAISVGWAVQSDNPHLLGFLSILSCIWMGAGLSLMSIVNEREVMDHERLLFLRAASYVLAKTAVLWFLAALQTAIFVVLLCAVRRLTYGENATTLDTLSATAVLGAVAITGVGLGLLISALAGTNRSLAGFILPLAMMMQIVFSVEVAGRAEASLSKAYGEFNPHYCQADPGCPRRARYWTLNGSDSHGWTCGEDHPQNGAPDDAEKIVGFNLQRPNYWAASASYATISRYADILLRGFADTEHSASGRRWQFEAALVLLLMAISLPAIVACVLQLQARHIVPWRLV
jgi:ABC-type multidrug transport system ATPase subunit